MGEADRAGARPPRVGSRALAPSARPRDPSGRAVDWACGNGRRHPHAAVRLVLRPGRAPARAGADLRAHLAVRGAPRPGRRAGAADRRPRRCPPDRAGARPGRRASRLPQRLPAPRSHPLRGRREARDDPVPLPRVDVRPRRRAPQRSARRSRARLRPSSLGLVPVAVDTWGPFVFVNPDPDAGPLADHLGELPELLAPEASTSARCGSTSGTRPPSTPATGRCASRTSSSATTAPSHTRAW